MIDEPQKPLDGVRFSCPPKWLARLISRAASKAVWVLYAGIRYRPDLYMGYNLVAGGCTALVAAAVLGRPSCYQMTGGQLVLSTLNVGTFELEKTSKFLRSLLSVIEHLAISVIKKFDLIIVRGSKGRSFLARYGIKNNVAIITGSVKSIIEPEKGARSIDLVFVGRLNPIKQVDQFIRIVSEISRVVPSVSAVIVGDGIMMTELKNVAERLRVSDNIQFLGKRDDIETILARSKIFLLTSKSEGMSIAMIEAMAAGAVPVVANVGELGDLVHDGLNGYLIEPNNIQEYISKVFSLLQDKMHWHKLSSHAVEAARKYSGIEVVAEKWRQSMMPVIERSSGFEVVYPTSRGSHRALPYTCDE